MLDFDSVLTRGPPVPSSDNDEESDPDRPVFSLATGRYRHAKRYGGGKLSYSLPILILFKLYVIEADGTPAQASSSTALISRDRDGTVTTLRDSAAGMPFLIFSLRYSLLSPLLKGEFLQSRTFRGLETRAGLDPPSILQQGRAGVARGYGDDHRV